MTDTGFALRHPDVLAADRPCETRSDPNEDGPWAKRCATHDLPWTSGIGCEVAARRARVEMAEAAAARDHARRLKAEASRAGLLALVEVGCEVYSTTAKNARGDAIGGVVVAIDDTSDHETGERERFFAVLDPHDSPLKAHRIPEAEVNRQEIAAAPNATLTRLFAMVAWEQAEAFRRGKDGRIGRRAVDTRIADRHRWQTALLLAMGMAG